MQSTMTLPGAVVAAQNAAPVESVPIALLKPADSPRLHGIVLDHVRHLASSGAHTTPILVHRETMRVIDGMHRLRVAQIRGESEIRVTFFDGDAQDAFIRAVLENNTGGLPLQLSDRKAAALRILTAHSDWSDRSIGKIAHLSAKTVALIRRAAGPEIPQPTARLGQDGRRRSLRASGERYRAQDEIACSSPGPIRPVVMTREVPPYAERRRIPEPAAVRSPGLRIPRLADPKRAEVKQAEVKRPDPRGCDSSGVPAFPAFPAGEGGRGRMDHLLRDPSLRFTDSGRNLLRKLIAGGAEAEEWDRLAAAVPERSAEEVAEIAIVNARAWLQFAEQVKESARGRRNRVRADAAARRSPNRG